MTKTLKKVIMQVGLVLLLAFYGSQAMAGLVKGIYLTQSTLENTKMLNYLITRAKSVGITTFVVDLERPSKRYENNIALLKSNNISYVARVVIFPHGGTTEQVANTAFWQSKFDLMQRAVSYGADQIQLDYIRFNTARGASSQHAEKIFKIIQWYKDRLPPNIPLQVDVFGEASFGESKHIGHNIQLFSRAVDAICPMVYPSHYEPYREHAVTPYETVYASIMSIKEQFNNKMTMKLYPYIELSNYRYPMSHEKKLAYIYAQIKAVEDAGADGWYAWSPRNKYDNLFHVLETNPVK